MTSAKLLVPAGTFVQLSGGEMFSPMQLGLVLMLPAFLTASIPPSLNVDEVSANALPIDGSSFCVAHAPSINAAIMPVRNVNADLLLTNMDLSLVVVSVPGKSGRLLLAEMC